MDSPIEIPHMYPAISAARVNVLLASRSCRREVAPDQSREHTVACVRAHGHVVRVSAVSRLVVQGAAVVPVVYACVFRAQLVGLL